MRKITSVGVTALFAAAALTLVLWLLMKFFTGANLITFQTGSMAPAIPQGSLAVTLPVDAHELKIGDVVTVKKASAQLPVTHRIVEIRDRSQSLEFVLQGDANNTPDFLPYTFESAPKVVFSAPKVGTILMILQSPLGMSILTLLATIFAVKAFWPKVKKSVDQRE